MGFSGVKNSHSQHTHKESGRESASEACKCSVEWHHVGHLSSSLSIRVPPKGRILLAFLTHCSWCKSSKHWVREAAMETLSWGRLSFALPTGLCRVYLHPQTLWPTLGLIRSKCAFWFLLMEIWSPHLAQVDAQVCCLSFIVWSSEMIRHAGSESLWSIWAHRSSFGGSEPHLWLPHQAVFRRMSPMFPLKKSLLWNHIPVQRDVEALSCRDEIPQWDRTVKSDLTSCTCVKDASSCANSSERGARGGSQTPSIRDSLGITWSQSILSQVPIKNHREQTLSRKVQTTLPWTAIDSWSQNMASLQTHWFILFVKMTGGTRKPERPSHWWGLHLP